MLMCAPAEFARDHIGPSPAPTSLVDPFAWLAAEHGRHRALCDTLSHIATLEIRSPAKLRRLAAHLTDDMALHVADEADDLFPRLRERMQPDDEITRVLGILTADHEIERSAALVLAHALGAAADTGICAADHPTLATLIEQYVAHKRRHIALMNAVLLPIARLRLTLNDQNNMARAMASRRSS